MIRIVTLHTEIFAFIYGVLFLGRDKSNTSRLLRPRACRLNHSSGLEQSLEKVVSDFGPLE